VYEVYNHMVSKIRRHTQPSFNDIWHFQFGSWLHLLYIWEATIQLHILPVWCHMIRCKYKNDTNCWIYQFSGISNKFSRAQKGTWVLVVIWNMPINNSSFIAHDWSFRSTTTMASFWKLSFLYFFIFFWLVGNHTLFISRKSKGVFKNLSCTHPCPLPEMIRYLHPKSSKY